MSSVIALMTNESTTKPMPKMVFEMTFISYSPNAMDTDYKVWARIIRMNTIQRVNLQESFFCLITLTGVVMYLLIISFRSHALS